MCTDTVRGVSGGRGWAELLISGRFTLCVTERRAQKLRTTRQKRERSKSRCRAKVNYAQNSHELLQMGEEKLTADRINALNIEIQQSNY
jgi:hypothetical protein